METATQTKLKECRLCGVQYEGAEHTHVPYGERVRKVKQEKEQLEKRVKMLEKRITDAGIPELEAQIKELTRDRDSWKDNCQRAIADSLTLEQEKLDWRLERAKLGAVIVFVQQFLVTLGINVQDTLKQIDEKAP